LSLILIADDEPQILELLCAIVAFEGHEVIRAKDGREGLALMHSGVDLVITDLTMPVKGGLEFIADLRQLGHQQPIIAMTAGGMLGLHEYLDAARAAGADEALAKPFSRAEVLLPINALLAAAAPEAIAAERSQSTMSA